MFTKVMRRLQSVVLAIVMLGSMALSVVPTGNAGATGWLSGFGHRKAETITGTADGIQTNYQMGVKVYYGSGVDGTESVNGRTYLKVYVDNHVQSDFDDVRFTKNDQTTKLSYWRESYTSASSAIFIVKFDSIAASPTTTGFYIYYDNPTASSESSGTDTFTLFEGFDKRATPANVGQIGGVSNTAIVAVGASGAWDDRIREIGNVLYDPSDADAPYKLTYTGYNHTTGTSSSAIGYAYSVDAQTWTKGGTNPIITGGYRQDPYLVKVGSTYYIYVEEDNWAGGVCHILRYHASSMTGTWTSDGEVLNMTGAGWEGSGVGSPVAWYESGTWYLVYEGIPLGSSSPGKIGLATSLDGLSFTRSGSNPIWQASQTNGTWVTGTTSSDDVVKVGGVYYLTYLGYNGEWHEGIASSATLTSWTDSTRSPISHGATDQMLDVHPFQVGSDWAEIHYDGNGADQGGILEGYLMENLDTTKWAISSGNSAKDYAFNGNYQLYNLDNGWNGIQSLDTVARPNRIEYRMSMNSMGSGLGSWNPAVVYGTGAGGSTYTGNVSASANDMSVMWTGAAWSGNVTANTAGVGYWLANDYKEGAGFRFDNVTVPQGATITSAYITLTCDYDAIQQNVVNAKIVGDKEADAAAFTSLADYQARRGTDVGGGDNTKRTTAEVAWAGIGTLTLNSTYNTPDISTVVQEIVNQGTWASGNHMVLFVDDHANGSTNADHVMRQFYSFDYGTITKAAKLTITYGNAVIAGNFKSGGQTWTVFDGGVHTEGAGATADTWYRNRMLVKPTQGVDFYHDSTLVYASNVSSSSPEPVYVANSAINDIVYIDWITVSKYTTNDPTFTAYGADEAASTTSPSVTTSAAVNVTESGATLQGALDSLGSYTPIYMHFEYGTSTSYGTSTVEETMTAIGGMTPRAITGLSSGQTYHFRAVARYNVNQYVYGLDSDFTTTTTGGGGTGTSEPQTLNPDATIRENYNTGGDGDSGPIYAGNWAAMQFTSNTTAHSVTDIRLILKRVGNPGTVTVSIRVADGSANPSGTDLMSGTLDGNTFTTNYQSQGLTVDETSIQGSTSYAIVVRAVAGDVANYILWQKDSGGGLASAVGCHSTNSGVSWTSDSPADYLFEIWGKNVFAVNGAKAYRGYHEADDLLVVADVENQYPPYYPTESAASYFYVALYSTNGTFVWAATPLVDWGRRPIGLYLSADSAAGITDGSAVSVRLIATAVTGVSAIYTLTTEDWIGTSGARLDAWCLTIAKNMETYWGKTFRAYSGSAIVLNGDGGTEFDRGVLGLSAVRGKNLFQNITMSFTTTIPTTQNLDTWDTTTTWDTELGTSAASAVNAVADLFSANGAVIATLLLLVVWIGVALMTGNVFWGMAAASPVMVFGLQTRVIPMPAIQAIASVMVLIVVSKWFFNNK